MSSARELLEQADALMRRNRRPPRGEDIPELTDAIPQRRAAARRWCPVPAAAGRSAVAPTAIDDIPELTEAVEEIEAPSIQDYPDDPDELSRWLQENEPQIPERRAGERATRDGTDSAERPSLRRCRAWMRRCRPNHSRGGFVRAAGFNRASGFVCTAGVDRGARFGRAGGQRILTEALGHTSEHTAVTRVTEAIELTPIAEPAEERLADDLPAASSADGRAGR